jgi:hypothetical protein
MLLLQWAGFGFGDLLSQLDTLGFFSFILPFMLVFAFSYAILGNITVFKGNKGSAAIIAFALGMLSLQFNVVPAFFATIFPHFGIGLSVLLVGLILAGVFIGDEDAYKWIFFGLGAIIFLVIVISSFSEYNIQYGFWENYGAMLIIGLLIIAGIVAVILGSKSPKESSKTG